jgi:hypothetical protein
VVKRADLAMELLFSLAYILASEILDKDEIETKRLQ